MPDGRRVTCKVCGRHARETGPISWRGKCGDCGPRIFIEACDGMHDHSGPWFEHWRRSMAASVGGVLVDDLEALVDGAGEAG
jgi:hypothetical protein